MCAGPRPARPEIRGIEAVKEIMLIERSESWSRVAQWVLTGARPTGMDYCQVAVTEADYCRIRALMMLGMSLGQAIRDAKQRTTTVLLYPYRCAGAQERFAGRVLPYLTRVKKGGICFWLE